MKLLFALLTVLFLFAGCREARNGSAEFSRQEKQGIIKPISAEELNEIIGRRNGKILLINVWATWCKPCTEEFPDLVKIADHYKNKNLDFISLNVDFGKNAGSLAADFLSRHNNPDFPVYTVPEKSTEKIIELLNKEWDGSIPATFIYDADSRQKSFILGSQDYAYFRKNIDSIMNLKI
jgi:thiol-disulfide isomerase/thioredoxin